MEVGGLYRLRGMSKNKDLKCLAEAWTPPRSAELPYLESARLFGYPGKNQTRYIDGTLFLCLQVIQRPNEKNTGYYGFEGYVVLTPDGKRVRLWHGGNKTKFVRAT
jgi:hypothetical protein